MAGDACHLPAEDFRRVIDVNVTGSFIVARQTAKIMQRSGTQASLLLVASMAGHAANRGIHNSNYNTSKAAVIQLCRSLALEWGTGLYMLGDGSQLMMGADLRVDGGNTAAV
ncbi:hypothetical protein F5883DRAFT_576565 [Diaporthe sp. PMI_573]|nr:hypothetical protein F5883DRAFT_576565 [Diaporthaceae sp. PMI_573]